MSESTPRVQRDSFEGITHKICCVCKADKPIRFFNKNRAKRDGLQYECGMCQSNSQRIHRRKKKENENE